MQLQIGLKKAFGKPKRMRYSINTNAVLKIFKHYTRVKSKK